MTSQLKQSKKQEMYQASKKISKNIRTQIVLTQMKNFTLRACAKNVIISLDDRNWQHNAPTQTKKTLQRVNVSNATRSTTFPKSLFSEK